jgi:hypothetical protein
VAYTVVAVQQASANYSSGRGTQPHAVGVCERQRSTTTHKSTAGRSLQQCMAQLKVLCLVLVISDNA